MDVLKKNKKIILYVLLVINVLSLAIILKTLFSNYLNKDSNRDIFMQYKSNGKINYKVNLKNNELLMNDDLNENSAYILNLVDSINITSLYSYESSISSQVNGNVKLIARLRLNYKSSSENLQNPELYKKDTVLVEDKIDFFDKGYSSIQNCIIHLDEYVEILKKFEDQTKIPIEGFLEIISMTKFKGKADNNEYDGKYDNMLSISLSDPVFKLNTIVGKESKENVYSGEVKVMKKPLQILLIVLSLALFSSLTLIIKDLFFVNNKTEYQKTIEKLLRDYDDIIVNTNTVVDINNYKLIEITEFKEMLNLSRELLLPIMNYEVYRNIETWFYVIKDDILYRYVVSEKNNNIINNDIVNI